MEANGGHVGQDACIKGNIAPPTGAMTKIPEALLVYLPNPLTDKVKILDHIIELKSPTASMDHIAT